MQAGRNEIPVFSHHRFWRSCGAAAEQHHGVVIRTWGRPKGRFDGRFQAILKPRIAGLKLNSMAGFFFLEQREEPSQRGREILLDVGRNHFPDGRLRLRFLDPLIKRRERYGDPGAG